MKKLLAIVMALMLSAALVITGCSSTTTTPTTGSTTPPAQQGTLQLLVTDAPPQKEVTAIELTISTIAVHAAQSQAELQEPAVTPGASTESESVENGMVTGTNEATTGWITIDPAENATFDLLQIKDIEESLAAQLLEAGKYTQIRLTVEKARVGLNNGALQDAEVPSGTIKFVHPFEIKADGTTTLLFDFDADRSVTVSGNAKIIVRPVVKLMTKDNQPGTGDPIDKAVLDFIKNTATFKFDGIPGSISFTRTEESPISAYRSWQYNVTFQTAHPGHGDRSGEILAQVITEHRAVVYYNLDEQKIGAAICDGEWDLMYDKELPKYIRGYVVNGGDTAQPDGPQDVPHTFVYQVKQDNGDIINVSYKAYPPSPAGDEAAAKITLDFYAGTIQTGDRLEASGRYDAAANTIVVEEEGNYIRTSVPRLEVIGKILSGGDSTPEAPADTPHNFVYTLQKDDGSTLEVHFTVYPEGDERHDLFPITLYNTAIQPGDYMMVYGTYDVINNVITAAEEGDIIKTYPVAP